MATILLLPVFCGWSLNMWQGRELCLCSSPSPGAKWDGTGGVNEQSPLLGAPGLAGNSAGSDSLEILSSRRNWLGLDFGQFISHLTEEVVRGAPGTILSFQQVFIEHLVCALPGEGRLWERRPSPLGFTI